MMKKTSLLILVIMLVAFNGCSSKTEEPKQAETKGEGSTPAATVVAETASEKPTPNRDLIVARFGDDGLIRLGAVLAFTESKEKNVMPIRPGDTEVSLVKDLRRRTVDQLLDEELTYRKAKEEGIVLPEANLNAMVSDMVQKKYGGSEEALKQAVEQQGMTMDTLKKAIERRFLISEYIKRKVQESVHVGEEELEPYYHEHIEDFTTPDVYDAHFLEIRAAGSSPEENEEARKKIESLRADIQSQIEKSTGMEDRLNKVIAFCREHSQDENKQGGSWWKVFGREGNIEPALEDAAEEAPMGQFGSIFELQRRPGFVTAYKRAFMPSKVKPFDEEAKETIQRLLYKERRDKLFEDLKASVKEGVEITIDEEALFSGLDQN